MRKKVARTYYLILVLALLAGGTLRGAAPDFAKDVRPILSGHCFKCHGPDDQARQAGLRLDGREAATGKLESGSRAIVPGKLAESELVRRILAEDEGEVMPPPAANKPLTPQEKQTLQDWIASGAEYQPHWAFLPPRQAPLPAVQQKDWPKNAIDHFILARLEADGLRPSPQADKYTLVRRVYLDLIGLPPTPEEADLFVNDTDEKAYEKLVGRLLDSPHYGERWARRWLDLARYADTNGYEKDRVRSVWPYRDWVIQALNTDLPFDQFTIEQLAGDMLPGSTPQQRIATGFHRNTMLNEEGGIDPLEFRYYAVVDRVNTTAVTWLGLTLGCAQCHTHKFDPIPQSDYYKLMAFLNNADEPTMDVPRAELLQQRADIEAKIAAVEADLPNRFPAEGEIRWHTPQAASLTSAGGASVEKLDDGSFRLSGANPDKDTLTLTLESDLTNITTIRVEAIADPALPSKGPGRTAHGNFVLTEVGVSIQPKDKPDEKVAAKLSRASADFEQQGFPAADAIDGKPQSGWAIHGKEPWNVTRTATFHLEKPQGMASGARWTIQLDQQHGTQHTLGRVRVQLGQTLSDERPEEIRRRAHRDEKFAQWLKEERGRSVKWTPLTATQAKSNLPLLTLEPEGIVFVSGDKSKRDVYDLEYRGDFAGVTAIRLEVLPDDRLPNHGPGRIDYEGPFGDFFLSEVTLSAAGQKQKLQGATQSFANAKDTAATAIDGDPQTGWSVSGGQGKRHEAVFQLESPLPKGDSLNLQLLFERYYAADLGKFRVWVTTDSRPAQARDLPSDVETLLTIPADQITPDQQSRLLQYFCTIAPELAGERQQIATLRGQLPALPTALVLQERPANNPRPTFIHKRGEFLQPTNPVGAELLSLFPPLAKDAPHDRLAFAKWLVSRENPLVGRVTVNRQWQAIFGRGIVRTTEDFGYQGEAPTHPELLDWLAVEFMNQGWSLKQLHKFIVMSATYQQSAAASPELLRKDPQNKLLARAPRIRLEAELVRDSALRISGLLSPKLGGPSVFPPQPANITTEGSYGALGWNTSTGEDRYRRGMYTFSKRTSPYAMFNAFDGPSGEACIPRREVSNSPLQALTLLNDAVMLEAAQKLGSRFAAEPGDVEKRLTTLFRQCLVRLPSARESELISHYYAAQKERLQKGELDAAKLAGPGEGDAVERAAWMLVARTLLNLDEVVTKE